MPPTIISICLILLVYTLIGFELRYHQIRCTTHIRLTIIILDYQILAIPFALHLPQHARWTHPDQRTPTPPPYERPDPESPTLNPIPELTTSSGIQLESRAGEDSRDL